MITNGYATRDQFLNRFLSQNRAADPVRDADIDLIIGAVSRLIEKRCNRTFYAGTAGAVRYFTAQSPQRIYVDDFTAITALETDDDGDGTVDATWAAADYRKLPSSSQFGWPYTWIEVMPEGDYRFPKGRRDGVKITGTFGWTAVPDEIREACLLQANRLWQRRSAPFGVQGANEFGAPVIITKLDPDIEQLLAPFVRYV